MLTPYRQPGRAAPGSLAWWTAPRTRGWRLVLLVLWVIGSGYRRWLQRQSRLSESAWLRETLVQLRKAEETARRNLDQVTIGQIELRERLAQLQASEVLHYKPSMLRGERGIRELEDYFANAGCRTK